MALLNILLFLHALALLKATDSRDPGADTNTSPTQLQPTSHSSEETSPEKLAAYIKRLEDIKERAVIRERNGANKYPKLGHDKTEESDAHFLLRRPPYPEAIGLWKEIRSWKPIKKDSPLKQVQHRIDAEREANSEEWKDFYSKKSNTIRELDFQDGHAARRDQSAPLVGLEKARPSLKSSPELSDQPKVIFEVVAISNQGSWLKNLLPVLFLFLFSVFTWIYTLYKHQGQPSSTTFYEEL